MWRGVNDREYRSQCLHDHMWTYSRLQACMLACCFRGPIPRRVRTVQARRAPLRGGRALHCRAARRRGPHGLGSEPRFVLSLLGDWLQVCLRQSRSQPCVGLARRVHTVFYVCPLVSHHEINVSSLFSVAQRPVHEPPLPTGRCSSKRSRFCFRVAYTPVHRTHSGRCSGHIVGDSAHGFPGSGLRRPMGPLSPTCLRGGSSLVVFVASASRRPWLRFRFFGDAGGMWHDVMFTM